jgi:O-antigen/teichoic acid export membrane protein
VHVTTSDHSAGGTGEQPVGAGAAASRGVLGRGSIYTLGTAAPVLANAAVTPAVTRLLGVDEYGVVSVGIVVMQIGMMVAGLGLSSVITRHGLLGSSGQEGARTLLVRGLALTAALLAVVVAAAPFWSPFLDPSLRRAAVIALLTAGCYVGVEESQAFLRVLDRPLTFVTLSLLATLGGPVLGLCLVLLGEPTAERYLVGLLGGYALAALVGVGITLLSGPRSHHDGDTRAALRMGLPMLPHMVSIFAANGGLVFLATALFGQQEAGRLSVALLLGMSPGVVTAAMNNSWGPTVYRTPEPERGHVLEHTAADIGYLAATMAGGIAALSPWLLRLAAGADFRPDELVPQVGIIAFGTVIGICYLANVHLVFASGRTFGLSLTTPASLAVGLALAGALSQLDPAWLALGFPLTYVGMAAGSSYLAHRVCPVRWRQRVLAGPVALGGLYCAAGALLPLSLPVRLAAAVLVAGVAVVRLRTVVRR